MQKSKVIHPGMILQSAEGFYKVGRRLALEIVASDKDVQYALPAAVVNFSFATELYLKALRHLLKMPDTKQHGLWQLYNGLPVDVKAKIEANFIVERSQSKKELSGYRIVIKRNKSTEQPENIDEDNFSHVSLELKYLLETHCSAFVNWRYLYEGQSADMYFYAFNFDKADMFLKAIAPILTEKYEKVKNKYLFKN
jgi:hypothetical protein